MSFAEHLYLILDVICLSAVYKLATVGIGYLLTAYAW
jgi:hypothetical protein